MILTDDFIQNRVVDFRPTSKELEEISQRLKSLKEQVPEDLIDIFLEIDDAYMDFMAVQNMEIYKRGFEECLQLIQVSTTKVEKGRR